MYRSYRAALMLTVPLLLGGCFERAQPSVENAVRPVQAVRVVLAADADSQAFAGTIKPRREADLGFRAAGRIASREVDVGSVVRAGQVLARSNHLQFFANARRAGPSSGAGDGRGQEIG